MTQATDIATAGNISGDAVTMATGGVITGTDNIIEAALCALLLEGTAVAALIGTRIYPNQVPQKSAMPAITYQQISGARDYTLDGPSGMTSPRFQINCWAKTYIEVCRLANAVRKRLNGYSGNFNTLIIHVIQLEDVGDMPQITAGTDVLSRYGKRLDFIVCFDEALI
jgi:hypothetical protein